MAICEHSDTGHPRQSVDILTENAARRDLTLSAGIRRQLKLKGRTLLPAVRSKLEAEASAAEVRVRSAEKWRVRMGFRSLGSTTRLRPA
jgi:hypothetical protein